MEHHPDFEHARTSRPYGRERGSGPENRRKVAQQAAAENANAARLDSLTAAGRNLVEQATRNDEFEGKKFRDVDEFKSHMDDFIRTLRATRPAPGTSGPLLPGDPEREAQKERDAGGVPVLAAVLDDLRDIARLTGVPLE